MFREAREQGLPEPEILEIGMRVRFSIYLAESIVFDKRQISSPAGSEQVGEQVGEKVRKFLLALERGGRSKKELLAALDLSDAYLNYKRHIVPLLDQGLIEMIQPGSPKSPTQKYRLTKKAAPCSRQEATMNNNALQLLEKHFDTAFSAPEGIKKLRELILIPAMRGKLVPQNPNDPPASELLKEIEVEKQRLVNEGKIKKPKVLPEIKAEEVPYELSQGWEWVRLRDICHDWDQKNPDKRFAYIDVGSIDNKNGVIGNNVRMLDSTEAPSRARKIVKKRTAIYSTVRPYLLNIAFIEQDYEYEPIASTAFAILHPYNGVSNRFIYFYLRSPIFMHYVGNTMKGVAYPAINDGDFFRGVFPLPTLSEQNCIVKRIDQLMARCEELEKLRAEREQLRLSVHSAAIQQLLDSEVQDDHTRAWHFLTRHFDDLYTVKENVAELRKAVLQLAHGEFVLSLKNQVMAV
jgi:hypothetical protein